MQNPNLIDKLTNQDWLIERFVIWENFLIKILWQKLNVKKWGHLSVEPMIVTCVEHLRGNGMESIVAVAYILHQCQNKNPGSTLWVTSFQ